MTSAEQVFLEMKIENFKITRFFEKVKNSFFIKDVKAVNEIISPSKRLPQKARVIKMNAFDTIVNIQEKWKKHKEKSAELLQQAKKRDLSHRERYANLQKKLSSTELENDRLKQDLRRLARITRTVDRSICTTPGQIAA